jgi:hypothetical protein
VRSQRSSIGGALRHPKQKRRVRLLALGGLALGVSACGVPIDSVAHPIAKTHYISLTPPANTGGTASHLTLYFVARNKLIAVSHNGYAYASIETTADELLLDLSNGPLKKDQPGLITQLSNQPGFTSTFNSQTHVMTVNLTFQFLQSLFGPALYEAYGQIVLTLMGNSLLSAVHGISFQVDGSPIYAYLPSETATLNSVNFNSYKTLIGTTAAPTTTT